MLELLDEIAVVAQIRAARSEGRLNTPTEIKELFLNVQQDNYGLYLFEAMYNLDDDLKEISNSRIPIQGMRHMRLMLRINDLNQEFGSLLKLDDESDGLHLELKNNGFTFNNYKYNSIVKNVKVPKVIDSDLGAVLGVTGLRVITVIPTGVSIALIIASPDRVYVNVIPAYKLMLFLRTSVDNNYIAEFIPGKLYTVKIDSIIYQIHKTGILKELNDERIADYYNKNYGGLSKPYERGEDHWFFVATSRDIGIMHLEKNVENPKPEQYIQWDNRRPTL